MSATSPSAPMKVTMGPPRNTPISRNPTEIATMSFTDPVNTLRAMSVSPLPRCIEILTDDPAATMSETAMNTVIIGHARLTAARASLPR